MRIGAVTDLVDDATNHTLSRSRLKMLSRTLVDLLNSVFMSQHTLSQDAIGAEISPVKFAEHLADMLVGGLVNANNQLSSNALQPLYKKLSKRTA